MSSKYTDPRDFVQHINGKILSTYLKQCHELDFDAGERSESREKCADRFIAFVNQQKEDIRSKVFMELEYINTLSSERHLEGLCALAPQIDRKNDIEKDAENYDERALQAYVRYPNEFDEYYARANIEAMAVKEVTLPDSIDLAIMRDKEKLEALESGIQEIYSQSMKGQKCKVKVFDDDSQVILRAYLEDLPTRDPVFDGDVLDEMHVRKPIFDVVFIYKHDLSTLGVRASGGREIVSEIQKLFCKVFVGNDAVDFDEQRYKLASLEQVSKLNLVANAEYGVERAYLKSLRLKKLGVQHKLFIDLRGAESYFGSDAMQGLLRGLGLENSLEWEVESMKITIVFKQTSKGRRKQVTVTITPPNTCDLKNRQQDDVVRRLLKDWGIFVR